MNIDSESDIRYQLINWVGMLGDKASFVGLTFEDGGNLNLADYVGKNIVLYFYPKDDTPGCTLEAKGFNDHLNDFANLNTVIIGVSKDSKDSHEKFKKKHCLNIMLASDLEGKACENYGVWVEKSMYGKKYFGINRSTFLIDTEGNIKKIWKNVSVTGHVQDVLEEVKTLNKGK